MTSKSPPERLESRELSRQLARELLKRLNAEAEVIHKIPAGTVLARSGEPMLRLPLVVSGRLDSVLHLHGGDGGQIIPVSFASGELAFLSQLFGRKPSFADLVAGEAAEVQWLPVEVIEQILLSDSSLMVQLVQFLVQRLRELQSRERAWLERGVHERVCATLARLSHQEDRGTDGTVVIHVTHEELSARSGVSRPKLSQELKRLEHAGRVRLERGSIRIVDLGNLFDPS